MAPPRMTANPKRPSRYRPGKGEDQASESEYETEEEEQSSVQKIKNKPASAATTNKVTGAFQEVSLSAAKSTPSVARVPDINEDEFETESEGEDDRPKKSGLPAGATAIEQSKSSEGEEESSEVEEDEDEEDTSSSSEEEAPTKLLRPTFIRKDQRGSAVANTNKAQSEVQGAAELEARRKEKADLLVQEQLERNAKLKANEKKAWDDSDNEAVEGQTEAEIDDRDGLDPEAERAAWKLRELKRVKRSREQIEVAEKEREEIERRRNLSKEEREAEDAAHLAAQEEEREGKGKAGYMQRYFHKGAFFQDSAYAEEAGLKGRDIMGSRFADQVNNREMLPEFMQIRDMAKLGRKGRTKYKDLKAEDTGRWGDFGRGNDRRREGEGNSKDIEVLDERFRPDDDRDKRGPSGANATAVSGGGRRERGSPPRNAPSGPRGNSRNYKEERSYSRSRSPPRRHERHRSRNRSPRRHRSRSRSRDRRKRSASSDEYRDRDRDERDSRYDKRARVT